MTTEPGTSPHAGAQDSLPVGDGGSRTSADTPDGLVHSAIYDVEASDPRSVLIDRSGVPPEELKQIARVMESLAGLREAEQALSQASRRYMRLNETDMRALHYLIVCANRNLVATPGESRTTSVSRLRRPRSSSIVWSREVTSRVPSPHRPQGTGDHHHR